MEEYFFGVRNKRQFCITIAWYSSVANFPCRSLAFHVDDIPCIADTYIYVLYIYI